MRMNKLCAFVGERVGPLARPQVRGDCGRHRAGESVQLPVRDGAPGGQRAPRPLLARHERQGVKATNPLVDR